MLDKYYLKQEDEKKDVSTIKDTKVVDEIERETCSSTASDPSDKNQSDSLIDLSVSNSVLANDSKTVIVYTGVTYPVVEKEGVYPLDEFKKHFFSIKDEYNTLLYYGDHCSAFVEKELNILSLCFSLLRNLSNDEISIILPPNEKEADDGLGIIENIKEFDKETLNA